MAKLLGIDVGTSGCKVLLIDESGHVLRQASSEYPLSVPRPMWSEQNPEDWWQGVQACLKEIGEPNPDAIGLTGQMHGAVFLDAADAVIRPAILWNDQRTAEECAQIDAVVGAELVRAITCNPPLTGFQLPKLLWLRNHEPENFAKVRSLLLPKDYIRFKLSGVKATEVSDASGTGAFDVPNRRWSSELMEAIEISPSVFPESFESDVVSGRTQASDYLSEGIPIVGGGGDQAAGAVGTGAVEPGVVSVSLGTSGVVFTAIDRPQFDPGGSVHTFCHANRSWHAMGVMLACGGALRWYRDSFGNGRTYDQLAAMASEVDPGSEGLTFLPYLTGERTPHNDPNSRASWSGATLAHGPSHFARSVFEGMSFGLLDGFSALKALGATCDEVRVTSGGAKSKFWVQMIADVFQTPCVTLESDEGPAFGAAILAGVGIGLWPSTSVACNQAIRSRSLQLAKWQQLADP
ncbi:MAG: xylulokinase [Chlorobia bacterium]|nr:xylulokinase [Fimbriimonadaceae bacterium]